MKRLIGLLVPIMVLLSLTIIITLSEAKRPAPWQAPLQEYLPGGNVPPGSRIKGEVKADHPWQFRADMAQAVVNDTWRTDLIPYPPDEVWCLQLEYGDGSGPVILFVSHHSDKLWRDDWLVYQGHTPISATLKDASSIGCHF